MILVLPRSAGATPARRPVVEGVSPFEPGARLGPYTPALLGPSALVDLDSRVPISVPEPADVGGRQRTWTGTEAQLASTRRTSVDVRGRSARFS